MTAEAVLERAQSVGVCLHLDDGQVRLSGDKLAIAALLPDLRNHRAELVQLLSKKAEDQMRQGPNLAPATAPDWTPPAPKPDPGLSRLMAAAMALCDRTGAGAKERADWCADVEAAMPEHRGDLLALVLRLMPKAMPTAVVSQSATPAKAMPKFSVHEPWNEADKAYQAHHWQCTTCRAAARSGHSDRCATGQQLHTAYEQAAMATKESK